MNRIIEIDEQRKIELQILDYVSMLCESKDLNYFLVGGSLLGAVRHNGFIPWDDDIDIALPRPDYEVLKKMINEDEKHPYRFLSIENDLQYCYLFGKIIDTNTVLIETEANAVIDQLGVNIDVYPLDGLGENEYDAQKKLRLLSTRCGHIVYASLAKSNDSFIERLKKRIWSIQFKLNKTSRAKAVEKELLQVSDYYQSPYVGSIFGRKGVDEVFKIEVFGSYLMKQFEGKEYRIPFGYHEYLSRMYGDYMKLPPVSERVLPHRTLCYWK